MMELEEILTIAVKNMASDIHLSPGQPPILRIDGELIPIEGKAPLTDQETMELISSIMTPEQQTLFKTDLEIDFAFTRPSVASFRVNAFNQMNGTAAVLRLIPQEIPTLDGLALPPIFKN